MSDTSGPDIQKTKIRLLKLLSKFGSDGVGYEPNNTRVVLQAQTRTHSFEQALIKICLEEQLVSQSPTCLRATSQGKAYLLRALHPEQEFAAQHQVTVSKIIQEKGNAQQVMVNVNESPLSRLYLRRTNQGKPWLNDQEFQAGERLRADFEKSQLQPRISANWVSSVASQGRGGNVSADISDFALDARKRVEQAIAALGPDLANVALDICCFLKGLETIESEHKWPPRSGKLMLRTALRELVRHYGLGIERSGNKKPIKHWGAEDFRPSL